MANANRASADLTLADAALSSFASLAIRARELAVQAASDVLTPEQRASIGVELEQLHGQLVSLGNSRNSAGHALFGGETAGDAFALDGAGNASYIGTASSSEIPIGDGESVTGGLTGPEFLDYDTGGTPTNLMALVKQLATDLQGAATDPAQAARDALDGLSAGIDAITTAQTVVGTRLSWIDLTLERHVTLSEARASEQADLGGTDIAASIADLQQVMLVLEASQASFAKLADLSLFAMVR